MIYITGAGCGDVSLLTLKAKQVLEQADCVIYDRLVQDDILSFVKPSCERVYVGKQNHCHTLTQDQINALLIEKAQQYANIVRLKGGDPYVFGRGSEEALYLQQHQQPFCVIPGITSCIAAGLYAGIPVTHRGISRGFRVMSAHSAKDALSDIDFASMANTSDTLVFLMGLAHVSEIVSNLLQAGKCPTTPIALISNGARSNQEVVVKTLGTIQERTYAHLHSPTTVMVGECVTLRDQLCFHEQRPLFHKRYIIASLQEEKELHEMFETLGASLKTVVCGHLKPIVNTCVFDNINSYTHIVFTSKHGVEQFFKQLFLHHRDARALYHHTLCAIGEKTSTYVLQYGCRCDIVSPKANSEDFAQVLMGQLTHTDKVLIVKAKNHNTTLTTMLQECCVVAEAHVYECVEEDIQIEEDIVDGILFTCDFVIHQMMKHLSTWDSFQDIPVYAMGKRSETCLKSYGFRHINVLPRAEKTAFCTMALQEEINV